MVRIFSYINLILLLFVEHEIFEVHLHGAVDVSRLRAYGSRGDGFLV